MMINKLLFCLVAFLFLSTCGDSKKDFIAESFILQNNARLIVLPDRRFPIITQMIWYPVGAGDELSPKTGLAHFLEHLMFQHEPHLALGGFSNFIETLGGRDNAFTSYDYTAYFQRFHPNQIEKVMTLEAERMTRLALSEKSALKERNVIIEEYHSRLNANPIAVLRMKMSRALYGENHPYGRDVIGRLGDIKALTKEDADTFYETFYAPARAIIVIAGDIDPQKALALAQTHYGALKSKQVKPAADFPPVLTRQSDKALIFHRDKRVRQAVLLRDYVITNRHILGAKQAASFEVLAEILIGGARAKLNRAFIVDEKIASFVGGGLDIDRRGPGEFSVQIWLAPNQKLTTRNLKKIYDKLDNLLTTFAKGNSKISPEEITSAKNRLLANEIYLKDSQRRLANFVGAWLATGHELEAAQTWASYIEQVSLDDIHQAAQYMLTSERALSGFLLPKK